MIELVEAAIAFSDGNFNTRIAATRRQRFNCGLSRHRHNLAAAWEFEAQTQCPPQD